jgi:hypothetical protein
MLLDINQSVRDHQEIRTYVSDATAAAISNDHHTRHRLVY